MFLWVGRKSKARMVPDGQFEKRRCPECGKTAVFREAVVNKAYSAWVVLKLWESESTTYVCDKCGSMVDLDDTLEPELSAREQAKQTRLTAEKAQVAADKRRLANEQFKLAEKKRDQDLDDELAQMKEKLGLE